MKSEIGLVALLAILGCSEPEECACVEDTSVAVEPLKSENGKPTEKEKPTEKAHIHREYAVFATNDAPVSGPEDADKYFHGVRLGSGPYHEYSHETRIRTKTFRIDVPDEIVDESHPEGLRSMLREAAGITSQFTDAERDLRYSIIFTGDKFHSLIKEKEQEPVGQNSLRPTFATFGGHKFEGYRMAGGTFYLTKLDSGKELGVIIRGY